MDCCSATSQKEKHESLEESNHRDHNPWWPEPASETGQRKRSLQMDQGDLLQATNQSVVFVNLRFFGSSLFVISWPKQPTVAITVYQDLYVELYPSRTFAHSLCPHSHWYCRGHGNLFSRLPQRTSKFCRFSVHSAAIVQNHHRRGQPLYKAEREDFYCWSSCDCSRPNRMLSFWKWSYPGSAWSRTWTTWLVKSSPTTRTVSSSLVWLFPQFYHSDSLIWTLRTTSEPVFLPKIQRPHSMKFSIFGILMFKMFISVRIRSTKNSIIWRFLLNAHSSSSQQRTMPQFSEKTNFVMWTS